MLGPTGRRRRNWALAAAAVALMLAGLAGEKEPAGPSVTVDTVQLHDLTATVVASGEIRPARRVSVSSDISGRIKALLAHEGDAVRRGQTLARIDSARQEANARQAEELLASARADLQRAEAERDDARQNHARLEQMYAAGLVPDQAMERAVTEMRVREAALESQRRRVTQQQAALVSYRDELEKSVVLAPIDGTVVRVHKELGETVIGARSFSPSVLMTLADLATMQAEMRVSEADIALLRVGQEALVEVEALGEVQLAGRVSAVGVSALEVPQVMRDGPPPREFEVRLALDEAHPDLRPGLTAVADIVIGRRKGVRAVPIQAIVTRTPERASKERGPAGRRRARNGVYVVVNRRAMFRTVQIGMMGRERVEISSGLEVGDSVVTGPHKLLRILRDGTTVR